MIAGIDGVLGGWVAVVCEQFPEAPKGLFVRKLADLPLQLKIAAVDVPIGLPNTGQREADRLARKFLGEARRRSVFPSPILTVLEVSSWEEACRVSERIDGRRISKQTFAILPKIREADELVRSSPWARRVVREVHPELSFAKWFGTPLVHRKKSAAGREERQKLIGIEFGKEAFETVRASVNGYGVGSDDIADAFAALWTAARILSGCAEPFPRDRTVDDNGTPMQMWA